MIGKTKKGAASVKLFAVNYYFSSYYYFAKKSNSDLCCK